MSNNLLTIDLEAVRLNLHHFRNRLPGISILAMVKAEAYGTRAKEFVQFLQSEGITHVGVSHVIEGINLRREFPKLSIFVIYAASFEAGAIVENDLEVSVSDFETIHALNREGEKQGKKVKVHLDINTGMHRFGCREEDSSTLAKLILSLPHIEPVGLMTHFIGSEDDRFDKVTHDQLNRFEKHASLLKNIGYLPKYYHAANSSGALRHEIGPCNMVRVGFALFGIRSTPSEGEFLKPAFTLETRIQAINRCLPGESVGYFAAYKASKEERIAILPIGYYDGIHLSYSGKGYVLIHGKKAPMLSRICMDFMMVNVTDIPDARVGDPVILFDKKGPLTVEEFAHFADTNPRQLLVSLGPRVKRKFLPAKKERAEIEKTLNLYPSREEFSIS